MTTVFIYKGIVGIQSDPTENDFISKPGGGSLGCICDGSTVKISKDALDALKTIPRGRDGLGEIEIYKTGDKVIFGWLGGYLKAFDPKEIETSRDYNPSVLTHTDDVEIPKAFMEFVDTM
jgi:hypothetical protein